MRGVSRVQRVVRKLVAEHVEPAPSDCAAVMLHAIRRTDPSAPPHPAYFYGVLRAAYTARAVRAPGFVAMEMGVATGRGLLALGEIARIVGDRLDLRIEVVGFDSGEGLPPPTDPRDVPYGLHAGDYRMDVEKLRAQLPASTELVIGDVVDTVPRHVSNLRLPIGFVANDLDFYTGTMGSLRPLASIDPARILPRVAMYFDDLFGYPYTTVNGEWAAIQEFNTLNPDRLLGKLEGLRWQIGSPFCQQPWPDMIYVLEARDHPGFGESERVSAEPLAL
jgi:hypothetical protein